MWGRAGSQPSPASPVVAWPSGDRAAVATKERASRPMSPPPASARRPLPPEGGVRARTAGPDRPTVAETAQVDSFHDQRQGQHPGPTARSTQPRAVDLAAASVRKPTCTRGNRAQSLQSGREHLAMPWLAGQAGTNSEGK